eukprot:TRINITY_DN8484_c0_g1_i1.p1 TRINITY_DN8484_c0_g1~~TRINITY_DN8484_c0_g1_i1.p1  ORF type:complete len:671 (+),score=102.31 TRINITY_DN8484_c0_g1_i1:72-2084(+)
MDRLSLPFHTGSNYIDNGTYCTELYTFLETHREIHSTHPEDYFRNGMSTNHPDKGLVKDWITNLGDLIRSGGYTVVSDLLELSSITKGGHIWDAVKEASPTLFEFARHCQELRLSREIDEKDDDAEGGRQQKFLERILNCGMSDKKRHEVRRMFHCIDSCLSTSPADDMIKTVINIGEGKGYLSRTLALCKGLQVVGVDCNPHHRDSSFERIDRVLTSRIFDDGDSFLYEPRGSMTSVTCRVDDHTDWGLLFSKIPSSEPSLSDANPPPISSKKVCIACGKIIKSHLPMLIGHLTHSHPGTSVPDATGEAALWEWACTQFSDFKPLAAESDPKPSVKVYKRGQRLVIRTMVFDEHKKRVSNKKKNKSNKTEPTSDDEPPKSPDATETVTVLGYDDSTGGHKVLRHSNKSRLCLPLPGDVVEIDTISPSVYPVSESLKDTMMIGLHTCGDLGSTAIKLWESSDSSNLVLVSCCWHSLTKRGFPLSTFVSERSFPTTVTDLSLMLATQPIAEGLSAEDLPTFISSKKLLFYRAMLPLYWPSLSSCYSSSKEDRFQATNSLPPIFLRDMARMKSDLTFSKFVEAIKDSTFAPTGPSADRLPADIEKQFVESDFSSFLAFVLLRNWMSQLVEAAFVIDRALLLAEKGCFVTLTPLFDGALSPRNFAIIASKNKI